MSDTLKLLLDATQAIATSRYLSGVAITLVVYDWILVAHDEAMTIWQSRWTVPKTLYYYIRISTIPFMAVSVYDLSDQRGPLSNSFCSAWSILVTVPMWTCFIATNWLFTLRLLALYKRRKVLVWFMTIFFLATYGIALAMLISTLIHYHKTVAYFPAFDACGALSVTGAFPAMFYAPAAYEAFIFALTAYQAYKDAKIISDSASAPFLIVLYRDGMACFLVMLAMRSWNIWIFATQPVYAFALGINMMWAINCVMATRVYLNLVWLVRKPVVTSVGSRDPNTFRTGASINMRSPTTLDTTIASLSKDDSWGPGLPPHSCTLEGVPEEYDLKNVKIDYVERGSRGKEGDSAWYE